MRRSQGIAVFLALFLVYLTASMILLFKVGYVSQEVNVRSGIASDLIDSNERGREGMICSVWWAPVPTLLQLTMGFSPPAVSSGAACGIISAASGALMCFFLFKTLVFLGLRRAVIYTILLLVAFNPWMLFYFSNGSSEAILLAVLAGTLWCFVIWYYNNRLSGLMGLSVLAALLPLIKHQAILFSLVILTSVVASSAMRRKPRLRRAEGTFYLAFFPTIYTVGLWFLFNWLIMGDFLYFLRGVYVDPVSPEAARELIALQKMLGFLPLVDGIAAKAAPFFVQFIIMPFFPAAVVLLIVSFIRKRNVFLPVSLGLLVAMPIYHIFMMSRGQSFGITKDALVILPLSAFLAGYFLSELSGQKNRAIRSASGWVLALMVLGTAGSLAFVAQGNIAMELGENNIETASATNPFAAIRKISHENNAIKDMILENEDDCKIALVGFQGYDFIRRARCGEEFIHSINLNLPLILRNTRGKDLYVIVPRPVGAAAFDNINIEMPDLYHLGETHINSRELKAHFLIETRDFPNWRVYTIIRPGENDTIFGTAGSHLLGS